MEKNNLALAEEITTSIPEKVERQKAKVSGGLVVKDLALSLLWLQSLLF